MKLSLYFDIYPWTKSTDVIYTSSIKDAKSHGAKRYRVDIEIDDPAQPDKIISAQPTKVSE